MRDSVLDRPNSDRSAPLRTAWLGLDRSNLMSLCPSHHGQIEASRQVRDPDGRWGSSKVIESCSPDTVTSLLRRMGQAGSSKTNGGETRARQ